MFQILGKCDSNTIWMDLASSTKPNCSNNLSRVWIDALLSNGNYLLKFFAFHSSLGCFVSLYWDGIRNHDREFGLSSETSRDSRIHSLIVSAEAHFFDLNKGAFNFTTPARRLPMPDFDKDLMEESRKGNFHSKFKPVLTSFQGQVFVYGRHPYTGYGFMGHYGRLLIFEESYHLF